MGTLSAKKYYLLAFVAGASLVGCQGYKVDRDIDTTAFSTNGSNGTTETTSGTTSGPTTYSWSYSLWDAGTCIDNANRQKNRTAQCLDDQTGDVVDNSFCGAEDVLTETIADSSCASQTAHWSYGPWQSLQCVDPSHRQESRTATCVGATSSAQNLSPADRIACPGGNANSGAHNGSSPSCQSRKVASTLCGSDVQGDTFRSVDDSSCASVHGTWTYGAWVSGTCADLSHRSQRRAVTCVSGGTTIYDLFCSGTPDASTQTVADSSCSADVCGGLNSIMTAANSAVPGLLGLSQGHDNVSYQFTDIGNSASYGAGQIELYATNSAGWTADNYQFTGIEAALQENNIITTSYGSDFQNTGGNTEIFMHVCPLSVNPSDCNSSASQRLFTIRLSKNAIDTFDGTSNLDAGIANKIFTQGADLSHSCSTDLNPQNSPLVAELGSNGIVTLDPHRTNTLFDLLGDGTKKRISCVKNGAYLTFPTDGAIRSIDQLFGNNTVGPDGKKAANGFDALKKFDRNHDLKITADDPVFNSLRLWQDADCDGSASPEELGSLLDQGISVIDLNYIDMLETDRWGNQTRQRSLIEHSDGSYSKLFDLWFRMAF